MVESTILTKSELKKQEYYAVSDKIRECYSITVSVAEEYIRRQKKDKGYKFTEGKYICEEDYQKLQEEFSENIEKIIETTDFPSLKTDLGTIRNYSNKSNWSYNSTHHKLREFVKNLIKDYVGFVSIK